MNSKHIPMIIGISLPILFILIISAVVYLPSLSVNPQSNFIYSREGEKYTGYDEIFLYTYEIIDGKLTIKQNKKEYPEQILLDQKPTLYLYDMKMGTSREISLADAQKLTLDPGPASPDGYTIEYKYHSNGIFELFGSDDSSNGYFVTKGKGSKKLTGLMNMGRYWDYNGELRLIGWIK